MGCRYRPRIDDYAKYAENEKGKHIIIPYSMRDVCFNFDFNLLWLQKGTNLAQFIYGWLRTKAKSIIKANYTISYRHLKPTANIYIYIIYQHFIILEVDKMDKNNIQVKSGRGQAHSCDVTT